MTKTKRKTVKTKPAAAPQQPQPDKDFQKNFMISWSVRNIIKWLPEDVREKKQILKIVDKLMRYEHGDHWVYVDDPNHWSNKKGKRQ